MSYKGNCRPAGESDSESDDDFQFQSPSRGEDAPPIERSKNSIFVANHGNENGSNKFYSTEAKSDMKSYSNGLKSNNEEDNCWSPLKDCQLQEPANQSFKSRSPNSDVSLNAGTYRVHQTRDGDSVIFEKFKVAAVLGKVADLKQLIQEGLAVDQLLLQGWTALMYAAAGAELKAVQFLLDSGANVNFHKSLYTVLMAACASRHSESDILNVIDILIKYDADVNAVDGHRMTPIMFASSDDKDTVVRRLLEAKANVNSQDNQGDTALHRAAKMGYGKVVRCLLEGGADTLILNKSGQQANEVAESSGFDALSDVIVKFKKNPTQVANLNTDPRASKLRVKHENCKVMEAVLIGCGCQHLIELFYEHRITDINFMALSETDLDSMGITKVGDRENILEGISVLQKKEVKSSCLPNLLKTRITLPESVALIENVNYQLQFFCSSINYLRKQVTESPQLLTLGQETYTVASLSEKCKETLKETRRLQEDVRFFKGYLDKVSGNAEYLPADLILERSEIKGGGWRRGLMGAIVGVSVVGGLMWMTGTSFHSLVGTVKGVPKVMVLDGPV